MKAEFKEFYQYTPVEIDDFWENAIFSFDANVLLNLYKYSESTSNDILETFEYFSKRKQLWLSYQAGFEYHNNRLSTITKVKSSYLELKEKLVKKNDEINSLLNEFKKHQTLNTEVIKETFAKTFADISDELKRKADDHPDFGYNDPILDKLSDVFKGCIGNEMTDMELNSIYKEGKDRYEKHIPPGYKDFSEKKSEPNRSLYGDLIIWKQLIKKAKESQRKFVFVTDDLKEDWWHISNGKTVGPRPELLKEFYIESDVEIIIYKPEQFLKFFKDRIKKELKEETIKEVEETRKNDVKTSNTSDSNRYSATDFARMYRAAGTNNSLVRFTDTDWFKQQEKFADAVAEPEWFKRQRELAALAEPEWFKQQREFADAVAEPEWFKRQRELAALAEPEWFKQQREFADAVAEPDWFKRQRELAAALSEPEWFKQERELAAALAEQKRLKSQKE